MVIDVIYSAGVRELDHEQLCNKSRRHAHVKSNHRVQITDEIMSIYYSSMSMVTMNSNCSGLSCTYRTFLKGKYPTIGSLEVKVTQCSSRTNILYSSSFIEVEQTTALLTLFLSRRVCAISHRFMYSIHLST